MPPGTRAFAALPTIDSLRPIIPELCGFDGPIPPDIPSGETLTDLRDPPATGGKPPEVPELCLATGWGESKLRKNLKLAQAAGRLDVTRVMKLTLAGVMQPVPVYRVIPAKKGKRG